MGEFADHTAWFFNRALAIFSPTYVFPARTNHDMFLGKLVQITLDFTYHFLFNAKIINYFIYQMYVHNSLVQLH